MTDQSLIISHPALARAIVAGGKGNQMKRAGIGAAGPVETVQTAIKG